MNKIFKNLILSLVLATALNAQERVSEDELLIKALIYTQDGFYKESAQAWKKLFELTNNDKYLIEYFNSSLMYKDMKDIIKELKEILSKKKNKELYELLTNLYFKEGQDNDALKLLEGEKNLTIEELYQLAYLYSVKGQDNKALEIYKKIYNKEKSWESLKGILSILSKEKKLKEAKELLYNASKDKSVKLPTEAYLVLAGLLDYKKETNKAIEVFEKLYSDNPKTEYLKQLISLYLYKNDIKKLISLLEETHYDDKLLYEVYVSNKNYVKAYKLLNKLKKSSKMPQWLAEEAILTYEIANKYNAVDDKTIAKMSKLFEEAFKKGVKDPEYYNYYGYTLIDYGKDIKKGIEYVKKALKNNPKNIYYLDSLAWGYFKLNNCQKAKEIIDKVYNIANIVKEDEIIKHKNKIYKCSKEK
jgi:tetratricopeptide (TPR) repeat protein